MTTTLRNRLSVPAIVLALVLVALLHVPATHAASAAPHKAYTLCASQTGDTDVSDTVYTITSFEHMTVTLHVTLDASDHSIVCMVRSMEVLSITNGTHAYDLIVQAQYMDQSGALVNIGPSTRLQGSGGVGTNVWDRGPWLNVPNYLWTCGTNGQTIRGYYSLGQNKQENSFDYWSPNTVSSGGPGYC